jgi:Trypsin
MMRKTPVPLAVLTIAILVQATAAHAITYGEPDGNDHPNVGALILDFADDEEGPFHVCSGSLIDEDVFLTASHCTFFIGEDDEVFVSFDEDIDPITNRTRLIPGSAVTNPNFNHRQSDTGDVAVVLLDRRVRTSPAQLPDVGLLDDMKEEGTLNGQLFTAVGYGVHAPERGGGPPVFPYDGMRWRSVSEFQSLESAWLTMSQNDSTNDGGTCFGDSGGPNFLGAGPTETDIVVSVTVTGDAMCVATNKTYRLDTAEAQAFIVPFLD